MVLGRLIGTREFCIKQVDNKDLWILGRGNQERVQDSTSHIFIKVQVYKNI